MCIITRIKKVTYYLFCIIYIQLKTELEDYKKEDRIDFSASTVKWWIQKETVYPTLYKIACSYLIAQATSVASERVFSTAGNILAHSRNRLSNDNVDKLVFLKQNNCE